MLFFIGIWLLYNVVLFSAVQYHEPNMCIYIYSLHLEFPSHPPAPSCPRQVITVQTTAQLHFFHKQRSKVMLKILQARLQQYVNQELPGVQAGFWKGRGTRDQISNILWIIRKQESSRKTATSALLTMPGILLCGSQQTGKSSKDGNTRPPYLPPEKSVCRSRSNSQNQTWNNRLVPNWKRSTPRLYIFTLLI